MGKETKLGKIGKFILTNKVLRCQVQLATRLVFLHKTLATVGRPLPKGIANTVKECIYSVYRMNNINDE